MEELLKEILLELKRIREIIEPKNTIMEIETKQTEITVNNREKWFNSLRQVF